MVRIRVRRLSGASRRRLRSSYCIYSMVQCVEQLIRNSLDASAKNIAVRLSQRSIVVIDNGIGIHSSDSKLVGQRHASSTAGSEQNRFGFRGETLASIAEICGRIEIETKSSEEDCGWRKTIKPGESRVTQISRKSCGTTIRIKDLFAKLPVRKKALQYPVEVEEIVEKLTSYGIFFNNVSFSLRDENQKTLLIQTQPTENYYDTWKILFSEAYSPELRPFGPHSSKDGGFSVEGWLGREPHYNSYVQFLYINAIPLFNTSLNRFLQRFFYQNSTICKWGQNQLSDDKNPKYKKLFAVYLLKMTCPRQDFFINDGSEIHMKGWHQFLRFLSSNLTKWLKDEGLWCEMMGAEEESEKTSTDSYSEKRGQKLNLTNQSFAVISDPVVATPAHLHAINASKNIVIAPEGNIGTKKPIINSEIEKEVLNLLGDHPSSPIYSQISTVLALYGDDELPPADPQVRFTKVKTPETQSASNRNLHISEILENWKNNIEEDFASHVDENQNSRPLKISKASFLGDKETQFGIRSLEAAKVIGQFDRKFVSCMIEDDKGKEIIVLIDQHAAHERILLEQLEINFISERGEKFFSSVLDPTIEVYLTRDEYRILQNYGDKLEKFGFSIKTGSSPKVLVLSAPKFLLDKNIFCKGRGFLPYLEQEIIVILKDFCNVLRQGTKVSVLPSLQDQMATFACRNAIRFNQPLTMIEMQEMLRDLSQCRIPFLCAHGRPIVIPLIQL